MPCALYWLPLVKDMIKIFKKPVVFIVQQSRNCRVFHIQHNLNLKDKKHFHIYCIFTFIASIHPYFANKSIVNAANVCEQWWIHLH